MVAAFFREEISQLQRGENSYESGHVRNMTYDPNFKPAILRGDVLASMKNKSYKVEILIGLEDDNIVDGTCNCPRGLVKCHHMAALCLCAHHNISVTDTTCTWNQPKEKQEESVTKLKEIFPAKPGYRATNRQLTDEEISTFKADLGKVGAVGFSWILKSEPSVESNVVPSIEELLYSEEYHKALNKSEYIQQKCGISREVIVKVATITTRQSTNENWLVIRKNRLTASLWLDECGFLGASPDGLIDDNILVEVKCPYKYRNAGLSEVLAHDKTYIITEEANEMRTVETWKNVKRKLKKMPLLIVAEVIESDEEDCFTIQISNYVAKKRKRNRVAIQNYVEEVVPRYNLDDFKCHFRLHRDTFQYLLEILSPHLIEQSRKGAGPHTYSPNRQLLVTLTMLSNQEVYRIVSEKFDISKSTAWTYVTKVCNVLTILAPNYIRWPVGEKVKDVVDKLRKRQGFPRVIGAIDGSHIPITAPTKDQSSYCNRHHYHSIILQAVTDVFAGEI
ncbi:hypothetical protein MML48_scaffold00000245 [Holotrichia oblita]|nr:hypothetical protein MML48_scaffold00000245 [Holotrichia oblita]